MLYTPSTALSSFYTRYEAFILINTGSLHCRRTQLIWPGQGTPNRIPQSYTSLPITLNLLAWWTRFVRKWMCKCSSAKCMLRHFTNSQVHVTNSRIFLSNLLNVQILDFSLLSLVKCSSLQASSRYALSHICFISRRRYKVRYFRMQPCIHPSRRRHLANVQRFAVPFSIMQQVSPCCWKFSWWCAPLVTPNFFWNAKNNKLTMSFRKYAYLCSYFVLANRGFWSKEAWNGSTSQRFLLLHVFLDGAPKSISTSIKVSIFVVIAKNPNRCDTCSRLRFDSRGHIDNRPLVMITNPAVSQMFSGRTISKSR